MKSTGAECYLRKRISAAPDLRQTPLSTSLSNTISKPNLSESLLWSLGLLSDDDLKTFHKDGTRLSGHPPVRGIPGIPFATGSPGAWA